MDELSETTSHWRREAITRILNAPEDDPRAVLGLNPEGEVTSRDFIRPQMRLRLLLDASNRKEDLMAQLAVAKLERATTKIRD